jgi:hypothetical protein
MGLVKSSDHESGEVGLAAAGPQAAQPTPPPWAELPMRRPRRIWLVLCFVAVLLVDLSWLPQFLRFSNPPTGDQAFYLMIVSSLVEDGDLLLNNNYEHHDEDKFYVLAPRPPGYVGMSAPYPLPQQLAFSVARPEKEWYGFHPPGLPLLLAPAWIVGGWYSLWWPATIVFMCVVGGLLCAQVFLLSYEVSGRLWIAWAVWLPIAFSNPVMTYSFLIFTELTTGLFVLYVFRRLALGWDANGLIRLVTMGLCIGWIPWLAWRCVPLAAALAGYAVLQWYRYRRSREPRPVRALGSAADGGSAGRRRGTLGLVALLVSVMLSAMLMARYNWFLYGSLTPPIAVRELGPLPPFHWPWMGVAESIRFATTAFALFLDMQWGLLPYAPIYLLSFVGWTAMLRYGQPWDRRLFKSMALFLPYFLILVSYEIWEGRWCPPARFLTTLVPLLAIPLAWSLLALSRGWAAWAYRAIYAALALVGLAIMVVMLFDSRQFWPSDRGVVFLWLAIQPASPLRGLDLRPWLPSFIWPDEVDNPLITARVLAAAMLLVLLCELLLFAGVTVPGGTGGHRSSRRAARTVLGWIAAIALIAAGWLVMNYPYLRHKTTLAERQRWTIDVPLHEARGIAYLEGKVYIAAYGERFPDGSTGPGQVAVLDVAKGSVVPFQPFSADGPLQWAHPGDVKLGAGGLLYVLNNGPADAALWVLRPSGEVVQQVALPGITPVAKGLSIGPDRDLYVADMVGGGVGRFHSGRPEALAAWRGIDGMLNNPSGVFADEDGSVYTTESFKRIQHLARDGSSIKTLEVDCMPFYFAARSGDRRWLDVSCDRGLFSIDRQSQSVQLSRVEAGQQPLQVTLGITYAPDGTLFVLTGPNLVAYETTH